MIYLKHRDYRIDFSFYFDSLFISPPDNFLLNFIIKSSNLFWSSKAERSIHIIRMYMYNFQKRRKIGKVLKFVMVKVVKIQIGRLQRRKNWFILFWSWDFFVIFALYELKWMEVISKHLFISIQTRYFLLKCMQRNQEICLMICKVEIVCKEICSWFWI